MTLDELLAAYRTRLHLPDPGVVEVVLASWVANLLPDDPLWLLVVGPPASGKTEIVTCLRNLPGAHLASDLSLAGLLTHGRREDDTGDPRTSGRGLLRDLGDFGVILAPELSTLIAESRREDSKVFGALREIATDGRYSRQIDGKPLVWEGKAGFLGCVTEAVDELGMGALGERFLNYRMAQSDENDDLHAAALVLADDRPPLYTLREVTTAFLNGLKIPGRMPGLLDNDRDRLTLLASFVARGRSTVTWDSRHDSIVDVPQPERSVRLLRSCALILQALRIIGCSDCEAWRVVRQVGLGSIRTRKRRVLAALLTATGPMVASGIAARARLPESGVKRDLSEMDALFGIVERVGESPPRWVISSTYRTWWSDLNEAGGAIDLGTLVALRPTAQIGDG